MHWFLFWIVFQIEKVKEILYQVDEIVRNGENIEKASDLVDNSILDEYLWPVDEKTCSMAKGIWEEDAA